MIEKRSGKHRRVEDYDLLSTLIIDKLEDIDDRHERTEKKIDGIEKAINKIALQQKDIDKNRDDIDFLIRKHDEAFGQEGIIEKIKLHQKGCPKEENKKEFYRVWGTISFISLISLSLITGIILKIMKLY